MKLRERSERLLLSLEQDPGLGLSWGREESRMGSQLESEALWPLNGLSSKDLMTLLNLEKMAEKIN